MSDPKPNVGMADILMGIFGYYRAPEVPIRKEGETFVITYQREKEKEMCDDRIFESIETSIDNHRLRFQRSELLSVIAEMDKEIRYWQSFAPYLAAHGMLKEAKDE